MGLARLSCCGLGAECAAGAVPLLPAVTLRGAPVPSLHVRRDARNIAKVAVAPCMETGVLQDQAIAYSIMRHQDLPLSHGSLYVHSASSQISSSHPACLKMGNCNNLTHTHTDSAFPSLLSFNPSHQNLPKDWIMSLLCSETFRDAQISIK